MNHLLLAKKKYIMQNSIQSPEGYNLDKRSNLRPLNRVSLLLDPLELSKMVLEIVYANHQPSLKRSLNKFLILLKKYTSCESVGNTLAKGKNIDLLNSSKTHL